MRVLVAIFILTCSACATHVDLNNREPFQQQVGKELQTQRVTYIYDFPHSPQSLWNNLHQFKTGGESELRTESPKAVCPVGSLVQLTQVRQATNFDNPTVIEALGQIQCGESAYDFRYVWGIGSEIHEAPWESPQYDASNTRPVLDDT